jgi:hypothetical protein
MGCICKSELGVCYVPLQMASRGSTTESEEQYVLYVSTSSFPGYGEYANSRLSVTFNRTTGTVCGHCYGITNEDSNIRRQDAKIDHMIEVRSWKL